MAGRGENKQDLEHQAALRLPCHELWERPSLCTKGAGGAQPTANKRDNSCQRSCNRHTMTQRVNPACPRGLARADPTLAELLARVKCWPGSPQRAANQLCKPCHATAPRLQAAGPGTVATPLQRTGGLHAGQPVRATRVPRCRSCPSPLAGCRGLLVLVASPSAGGNRSTVRLAKANLWLPAATLAQRPAAVSLLSTDTTRSTSLCLLHQRRRMHTQGQYLLVVQPAPVAQPGPSSSASAPPLSYWHRTFYSNGLSAHYPLLSTMGFSQERSFPRSTSNSLSHRMMARRGSGKTMVRAPLVLFTEEQPTAPELLPGTGGLGNAFTLFVPTYLLS